MAKFESIFVIGVLISSLLLFFSSFSVSAKEAWTDQGLDWYYDNLTDEDRQKIRQAMDYAIPREKIIDEIMRGYALPVATDITSNMMGHDSSIQAREFNLTKSKELLAEVFGKRYENGSIAQANATITNTPYFKLTLIEPSSGVALHTEPYIIAREFNKIGIETELKWWNWNIIMPRLFLDPKTNPLGADFDHEGFDGYLLYFYATINPDYSGQYYPESFVPLGHNSMYIDRPDLVAIINRSLHEPLLANRLEALNDYQQWFFEWVPKCTTCQAQELHVQDPDWVGFDPYLYGRYPWVHNMTYIGDSEPAPTVYTSTVPGTFVDFNPMVSNSWYDSVWQSNVFLSLAGRRGLYNLSHCYPLLAENWTSTVDGLEWTVNLREGVTFHDGSTFDAEDVITSYTAAMECPTSTFAGDMSTWFDENTTWIERLGDYQVKFTLKEFYPYVEPTIFGTVPILSADQITAITYADWKTDATNTGITPLVGNGPYKFISYSSDDGVSCEKWDDWNATLMGHDPDASGGGIWLEATNGPEIYNTIVNLDASSAVAALKSRTIQLIDSNTGVFGQLETLRAGEDEGWCNLVTSLEYGWKELAFNHYDPRWGLNPHDPREMYPEDYPEDYPDNPSELLMILNRLLSGGFFILTIILIIVLLNRKKLFE